MDLVRRFIRWCPGAVGFFLRQKYYPRILGSCGKKVIFGRFLNLNTPERICIGDHVILSNAVCIDANVNALNHSQIVLESNVFIGAFSSLIAKKGGQIYIREGANIGSCCSLQSDSLLEVGEDTLLAAYCTLGLAAADQNGKAAKQSGKTGTSVGAACWLGVRVQQNTGTRIGKGSIIGAHALVTRDIPEMSIAVGRPAQVHRKRQ